MGFSTGALLVAILALLGPSQGIPQLGSDPRIPNCLQFCTANYDPVCGSNGQTYGNDCELGVAACEDPTITKASDGGCPPRIPNCPKFCTANYDPVCGSNGQTYGNDCELGVAACEDPTITKASDGECLNKEPDLDCKFGCLAVYHPVCGTDGKTYGNQCNLARETCKNPSIQKAHDGECGGAVEPKCPQICPFIYDPVCGSNGQTYSNECQLGVAACEDPTITKVSDGQC